MKRTIEETIDGAATVVRSGRRAGIGATRLRYRRFDGTQAALFAAPPPDLLELVIAESLKRCAQAEYGRDALRDALYEMPAPRENNEEHATRIRIPDSDD